MSPLTWSALYWIIVMFSGVNSVAESFIGEKKGIDIYMYSVADPHEVILSKIIYNALLCGLMSLACFILFSVFFTQPGPGHDHLCGCADPRIDRVLRCIHNVVGYRIAIGQ